MNLDTTLGHMKEHLEPLTAPQRLHVDPILCSPDVLRAQLFFVWALQIFCFAVDAFHKASEVIARNFSTCCRDVDSRRRATSSSLDVKTSAAKPPSSMYYLHRRPQRGACSASCRNDSWRCVVPLRTVFSLRSKPKDNVLFFRLLTF